MKWEEYLVPNSLGEALAMLKERRGQARVIAGGTDLIIQMKKKEATARCLVDVTHLDELKGIELEDGFIRVGACVTHQELASSSLIRERAAALAEGASQVGSPQIRNMALWAATSSTPSRRPTPSSLSWPWRLRWRWPPLWAPVVSLWEVSV